MSKIDLAYITETCDSLTMVSWDRCVLMEDQSHAVVYGWIPQEPPSARRDFVAVQFWFDPPDEPFRNFLTSSAEWSETINEILLPGEEHLECQTVQDMLPDLKLKVRR